MPLDPYFAERLRVHRRHLFDKARGAARQRLVSLWPFGRSAAPAIPAAGPATDAAPRVENRASDAEAPAVNRPPGAGTKAVRPDSQIHQATLGPRAEARAKKRKAAVAWDRKELKTVGTRGPDIPITEHRVTVDGFPDVRVRIYRPPASDGARPPVCLALFGGAFRIGGIDYPTTDAGYRRRAADSGVAIAAVDYALAPEHQYPTQVEQAYAALEWLFGQASELGLDGERIGILGTSAGGNLAAALTLVNRDRGRFPVRLQILEVPVTDLTGRHVDLGVTRSLGIPNFIARRELRSVARTYLPRTALAREPYASPLLAPSLAGLPPAYVFTAEYDPLRSDGAAYAAALREAGVEASAVQYLGVTHDTPIFTGVLPAARRWHDDIVSALRRLHDGPGAGE
ncbi:alpha/beta hydrolase [Microbacterium sp. 4R-513]|uniref:alpha/beta hydrolase n=1 Tax=Microbacterium sp. 4R-513 TaxID=2567934 RepID=UPI0013E18D90|nr:alpha/beta hydrolase [Microbacterium sp. 4R-513]QIG39034.1 alpha/beta hydrolase [Microbacterium sp. 4R-513]